MINPNGDEFTEDDPLAASMRPNEEGTTGRLRQAAGKVSTAAEEAWQQTKQKAGTARERTEFFLRENPVPTVIGALILGVAIGLAIRYASSSAEKEVESKSPIGSADLSVTAPHGFREVFLEQHGGKVDAADLNGALQVQSGGGPIHLDRIAGPVSARTAGGEINLGTMGGSVRCTTAGG